MILTFPYYDPDGTYSQAFRHQLATLTSAFDAICISAIPPTSGNNPELLRLLEEAGCVIFNNDPDAPIGDQSRAALRMATEQGQQPIFFGFLNRLLFDLETKWRAEFLQDLAAHQTAEFLVFERSDAAWDTHPSNYREIEGMVSRMFELLSGRLIELMPCGLLLSQAAALTILDQSASTSWNVWGEWILLALKNDIPVTTRKVDWLAYQHPFWERVDPDAMKRNREASREETVRRITMNMPVALMLAEDRFRMLGNAGRHR